MSNGANHVHQKLREELINYIKSQYFEKSPVLLSAVNDRIGKEGVLYKPPYIESSPAYVSVEDGISKSNLPDWLKEFFSELSKAKLGVYPAPFKHQIQALENYYRGKDLFVSTGTGSGKTECFMWPLIAKLATEAKEGESWNNQKGVRAVVMYPMNALVSDQISRLRRLLGDPENKFIEIFRRKCCANARRPKFGMYTGRTPYPGEKPDKTQDQKLAENLEAMVKATTDSEKQYLQLLQKEGKIPAKKDLKEFLNKLCNSEHTPNEEDSELITRFEMQKYCPDILITNYTMLEYMLLRPIEKKIWEDTKEWLKSNTSNKLLFIIDEAHMYKGASGGEIALLIRRFFHKLGIARDRVQFILTTASMPNSSDKDKQKVRRFAEELTAAENQDSFVYLNGERQRIEGLQEYDIPLEYFKTFKSSQFENEHGRLESLNNFWSRLDGTPQNFSNLEQAYIWMFNNLIRYRPFFKLISLCRESAVALDELADKIFEKQLHSSALHAVSVMLAITPLAKDNNGSVLFPARMHMLFRGINGVYACSNPNCPHSHSAGGITLGEIFFSDGVLKCPECNSAVYELFQDRRCGALFFSGFIFEEDNLETKDKVYFWRNAGQINPQKMRAIHLYIPPVNYIPSKELKSVKPCYMDVSSGFINFSDDSLNGKTGFRKLYYSTREPTNETPDFNICPHCLEDIKSYHLTSFGTKGNHSFFNLIKTQFELEPPIENKDPDHFPNQGRKVLIFSDSRQQAAKLALNMSEASEIMAARQLFVLAIKDMEGSKKCTMNDLYSFFCKATIDQKLQLFHDQERDQFNDGRSKIIRSIARNEARGEKFDLSEISLSGTDSFYEYLLRLFCGINNLYSCASCWIEPISRRIYDIMDDTGIESEEDVLEIFNAWFLSSCMNDLALGDSISVEVRKKLRAGGTFGLKEEWDFKQHIKDSISESFGSESDELLKKIKKAFKENILEKEYKYTDTYYINLENVRPRFNLEHVWYKCERCSKITPFKLKNKCPCCGFSQIHELREEEKEALNFWRKPIQEAINGSKIHIINTEEHTAQLSYRDQRDDLLAKTEQYELRFQDLLKKDESPVDILSSTTTMEVGIDIGSLIAVGLRNIPPLRENYQQRAGRAGRRGSSLSTIVTFCGNGPHDTLYFNNPVPMFRGDPRSPWIDVTNEKIVRRHLNMIAIQNYLNLNGNSIDKITVAEFINNHLDSFFSYLKSFSPKHDSMLLPKDAKFNASNFVYNLCEQLNKIKNSLVMHPDFYGIKDDGEVTKKAKSLLDSLYEEGIIPTYSFPKNVVGMYIPNPRGGVQYKIDRGLDVAISEFAPGKSLVVDKKNYLVGGLYYPDSEKGKAKNGEWKFSKPAKAYLEDQNYVKEIRKCNDCKWFGLKKDYESAKTCPFCGSGNLADASRLMVKPWGFAPKNATDINESSIRESYSSSLPPLYSTLPTSDEMNKVDNTRNIRIALRTNQTIIMINNNNDRGFCICKDCGAAAPNQRYKNDDVLNNFDRPYKNSNNKPCSHRNILYIDLGYHFVTDMLVMEFKLDNSLNIKNEPQNLWLSRAAQSFAEALRLVACQELDVEFSELVTGYRVRRNPNGTFVDVYLYDSLSSGAGYAVNVQDNMREILDKIEQYLQKCDCDSACFNCLKHYRNQYVHNHLDRHAALDFLYWGRDGKVSDKLDFKSQTDLVKELENILNTSGYRVVVQEPHIMINHRNQTVPLIIYPSMMKKPEARESIYINKDLIKYAKPEVIKEITDYFNSESSLVDI